MSVVMYEHHSETFTGPDARADAMEVVDGMTSHGWELLSARTAKQPDGSRDVTIHMQRRVQE